MAGKACHVVGSATQVGLTQVLDASESMSKPAIFLFQTLPLSVAILLSACTHQTRTTLEVEGSRLFLLGTFDHGTYKAVLDTLDAHPEVDTLVFTANGGSIDDECTLDLGREIRRRKLNTHLVEGGVLASGGVSLFLAGAKRTVEAQHLLGVHSWEQCSQSDEQPKICKDARDVPDGDEQHMLHKSYISEMLGGDTFYWRSIRAAPSTSIHWLTEAELDEFGLFHPADFTAPLPDGLHSEFLKELEAVCGECARPGT